jgi:integrator complex subunit 2
MQCIVCSFIHQMFIDNANLAEVVHFQGYPTQLVPILVGGVPSMHICLEFLPKLLSHYDLDKQIFAINLAAHLCEKYPIVRTYNVAKLAINVSATILQSITIDERKKFFKKISSAIVIFYTKLPPLTQECMSLLTNAIQTKSIVCQVKFSQIK